MSSGLINLADVVRWVSTRFEVANNAPVLTVRLDAKRRMVQMNTCWPEDWPTNTPFVYIVEGRDKDSFDPLPFFDLLFLDSPCQSLEHLLKMCDSTSVKKLTIHRLAPRGHMDVARELILDDIWKHLTPKEASNEVSARGRNIARRR